MSATITAFHMHEFNLLWDLNQTFRVGFEFAWRETDYNIDLDNEGAGFHTQFQWAF